jgi:hypothetical protein
MMSVIRICRYRYPGAAKCPPLLIYTSSTCHWHLVKIRSREQDGTALIYMGYAQFRRCRPMVADFPGTSLLGTSSHMLAPTLAHRLPSDLV